MPFVLPWWASALLTLIAKSLNQWLANLRAERAMRDLGAQTQAADSLTKAERQEADARAEGTAAEDGPDDPDDLRSE